MKARQVVKNMKRYKPSANKDCIKLDANERYNLDVMKINELALNRYPDNDSKDFKEVLSNYLSVDASNLLVGNGSSEMIELLLKTYIDPEDVVMSFTPGFVMYQVFTELYNGKFIGVKARDGYLMDIEDMILAAKKYNPKIIFICNPNNPTGYLFKKEDIERLIKNVNCLVVVDEAYIEFTEGSMVNKLDYYQNLVILRTFSKAWGLAAARLGYMIANASIIALVNKVKSPYNLNQISQNIGIQAIKNKDVLMNTVRKTIVEREKVYKFLAGLNVKLYKSSANFLYFKSDLSLADKLLAEGVLIRSFSNGYFRVTIGAESENEIFMQAMKNIYLNEKVELRSLV